MKTVIVCLCLLVLIYAGICMTQSNPSKAGATFNSIVQPGTSVEGPPTISAALINRVLAAAGSQAVGTGQALYADGLKYGIDPAYALAFFQHESSFGLTGVARATLSLGNIRCTAGYQCIDGFRAYQSWQAGYEDWYKLIRNLYISQWHLTTVEQIVPVYAPTSDHNDVAGYIAAIEQAVKAWRSS
jgi:hypothetical protein